MKKFLKVPLINSPHFGMIVSNPLTQLFPYFYIYDFFSQNFLFFLNKDREHTKEASFIFSYHLSSLTFFSYILFSR